MERRHFLRIAGISAMGSQLVSGSAAALELYSIDAGVPATPEAAATDESFWNKIRGYYSPPAGYTDFDQANTSPTATPVFDAFVERSRKLSHAPAYVFDKMWDEVENTAKPMVATYLGTQPGRIAFMANATNALNTVLQGFPLERGDEILVTNHEYPDMVQTILQREKREGIVMRVVQVPAANEDRLTLVSRVMAAITPHTKLLLISHVSAWSGEILPVAEVTEAARKSGVAVLVDAAQSVGMLDVNFDKIGCDFLATSFHKWLGAPLATGALIMRAEHVGKVWPLHPPSWDTSEHPMDLYEWAGSCNMATTASIVDALAFQKTLGRERKLARVRYLGNYWQQRLRDEPKLRVLTPRDPLRYLGVASVMVDGVASRALAKYLHSKTGILIQDKSGNHSPFKNALRVSPGPCATPKELDHLVAALRDVARNGIPATG